MCIVIRNEVQQEHLRAALFESEKNVENVTYACSLLHGF